MSEAAISMDALAAQAEEADAEEAFFVDTEGYEGPLHMLLDMAVSYTHLTLPTILLV